MTDKPHGFGPPPPWDHKRAFMGAITGLLQLTCYAVTAVTVVGWAEKEANRRKEKRERGHEIL